MSPSVFTSHPAGISPSSDASNDAGNSASRSGGSGGPGTYGSPDLPPTARVLDPLVVGRHVLRAIREDALYIIARHPLDRPERREQIEAATGELLDAFERSVREPLD